MKKMRTIFLWAILLFLTMDLTYVRAETDFQIQHTPLLCVTAEIPIEVPFEVISPISLKEARVYFKKQGVDNFYFVQAQPGEEKKYVGRLPAPQPTAKTIEYILLVVDEEDHAIKSPLFAIPLAEEQECLQSREKDIPINIVISAENDIPPEIGFSGEHVAWETSGDKLGTPYLDAAVEKQIVLESTRAVETDQNSQDENITTSGQKSSFGKKAVIGLGAGVGALALVGVAVSGGGGDGGGGGLWNPIDDIAEDVVAALYKSPDTQTTCGTVVTNQLYVTNNRPENIMLGTIDYEVIVTTDNPSGSCEPVNTGAFAPGGATTVPPGETVLVRQWSNEVNPCYGCPYSIAECVWESRYIVHTSAGSAIALSTFSAQGDLCGGSSGKKPFGFRNQVKGDYEP